MKKHLSYSYVIAFVLLLIMPTIVFTLFGHLVDQTNYEQRNATEKPDFSIKDIDEYPAAYEAYFNDSIPFRTQLIEMNSLIEYFIFKESPSDMVVLGKDKWLFYNPGGVHYNPIADYSGLSTLSEEQMEVSAQKLLEARDYLSEQGKEFVVIITPNKECVYGSEFIPSKYGTATESTRADQLVTYLKENTDLRIVYPKEALQEHIEKYPEYNFYYKSDTHWNYLGGYVGARDLLLELGIDWPSIADLSIERVDYNTGDLIGMMGLTKYLKYDWDYSVTNYTKHNDISFEFLDPTLNDPSKFMLYTTTGADSRKICVLRDSYTTAMTPYITSAFNTVVLLHRGIYTPELLSEVDADIVVLQVVEREIESFLTFTVKMN